MTPPCRWIFAYKHFPIAVYNYLCLPCYSYVSMHSFLKDKFIYRYDTVFYRHDVLLDFISLAFIITYVVLLILSRKKNNYVIPIIILISFILQFVSIFLKTIIMKSVLQDIRIYYIFINLLFCRCKLLRKVFGIYAMHFHKGSCTIQWLCSFLFWNSSVYYRCYIYFMVNIIVDKNMPQGNAFK